MRSAHSQLGQRRRRLRTAPMGRVALRRDRIGAVVERGIGWRQSW